MKALTILQPYAHLITIGEKRVENRTWKTNYRGDLIIHAGKSKSMVDAEDDLLYGDKLIYGAIVAVAELTDCVKKHGSKYPWLSNHPHAFGPWCWILENVRVLNTPLHYRGQQGLFDIGNETFFAPVNCDKCVYARDLNGHVCINCGDFVVDSDVWMAEA